MNLGLKISRRDFLKLGGVASGGLLIGDGLRVFVPAPHAYAAGAEETLYGTCGVCSMGCAYIAHLRNGRIVRLTGNPNDQTAEGKLCVKGYSGLRLLYDPDRIKYPLKRTNPEKGIGVDPGWVKISEAVPENYEFRGLKKDGTGIWIEARATLAECKGHSAIVGNTINITARKRAEEARRASEAQYRLITQNTVDVIWTMDVEEQRFTYISPSVEWLRGYTPDEVMAQPVDAALTAESARKVAELLADRIPQFLADPTNPVRAVDEMDQSHKDGSIVHTEITTTIWLNPAGRLEVVGISRDITARKRAEEALREREAFLQTLLNAIPIPVFYKDREGRYLGFNRAFEVFFGETRERLVGKSVFDISPPEIAEVYYAQDNALLENGGTQRYESQVKDTQGMLHDVIFHKAVFTDSQGAIRGLIGGILDITARKQAENELRESEQRYRTLLESINDSIVVIAPDFEIVQTNYALERDIGKGRDIIGERCFAALYGAEAPCAGCPAPMALATGQEQRTIAPFPIDNPRQWLHLKAFPMRNTRGELTHIIEVARDITEQQQTKLQLEEYAAKLERSNADLQQFATIVSHDLQTPLRMVTNFLGLLEKQYRASLAAEAQEYIDFAATNARQMSILIHDLLQYSRIHGRGQEPAPVDTAPVLANILRALQFQISDCGAELTHDSLPVVCADATQVSQLFQNLLGNALKFRRPNVPPRIHLAVDRQGDKWQFAVRDNGIGIAPEYHEHIFTIFQRGAQAHNDEYEGTGVGLAICQKIVERHGGRIWVESAEGQGTTFYFTLPAAPKEPKQTAEG